MDKRANGAGRGRRQWLGRHLMLKGEYAELLLSGRKKATIRLGIVRPKYREVIIHGGGRPLAKALIEGVEVKRVRELTDEDARLDGFRSRRELLEALRRAYGRMHDDDPVTILRLRVVGRLDVESDDPYMGLEPGDIARIALRYLDDLGEEERRILRSLTQTNSIRKTAVQLYGGVERRWRVRQVLRRAMRDLRARGLLGRPP